MTRLEGRSVHAIAGAEQAEPVELEEGTPEGVLEDDFLEPLPGPIEVPLPDGWFEMLGVDGRYDGTEPWEDSLEDHQPDLSLASSRELGCIVSWHCRRHPAPNVFRGCEGACLWTRAVDAERPNCFGCHRGLDVVAQGDLLYEVVQRTCDTCVVQRGCKLETLARRAPATGTAGRERGGR